MSSDSATDWCQQNKELHNVEVGKSWGTLPTNLHDKWSVLQCDQFLRNDNDSPPTYLFLFCLSLFFTLIKLYQDTTSNNPINSQSNNPIKKNV